MRLDDDDMVLVILTIICAIGFVWQFVSWWYQYD